MEADEKACPYCAETIKSAAIVCKHCSRDVPSHAATEQAAEGLAALSPDLARRAGQLGITWTQGRWVVDGCYFTQLYRAIEFAESPRTPPTPASTKPPRGPLFWLLAIPTAAITLFVGSAVIAGFWESASGGSIDRHGEAVERICLEDSQRAGVDMDCKAIRRIAEEKRRQGR